MINKKDLQIIPTKGTGPGGQHKNVTLSACRVIHTPTGATVTIDGRCFHQNKRKALREIERLVKQAKLDKAAEVKKARRDDAIHNTKNIRTYNYARQTVKDHRTKKTCNLFAALDGKVDLYSLSVK